MATMAESFVRPSESRGERMRNRQRFLAGRVSLGTASTALLWLVLAPFAAAEETSSANQTALAEIFSKQAPESVEDLLAIQRHVTKLVKKTIPCTVGVRVRGAQGSGVIVSKDGYVLTAGHVSQKPGLNATITLHNGRRLQGVTLGRNIGMDSGLIKITDEGDWDYVEMGSSKDLKLGEWCLAIGHPGGFQKGRQPVVRLGRILEKRKNVLRTDCPLLGGDSGGPLLDMKGRVVGVHSKISRSLTANFHVPIDTYRSTWDRLVAKKVWGGPPPIIGIRGENAKDGLRVTEVFSGLPADNAGIKKGDVIIACNGQKVASLTGLIKILSEKKPGDEITLEFRRDGKTRSKKMKLAARTR